MPGARLLGLVRPPSGEESRTTSVDDAAASRLAYLDRPVPVTDDLLALAGGVSPTRVFRFAAPCAGDACQHFDGHDCRLATRIVRQLPPAIAQPPTCSLRPACRWWTQEGEAACRRCPMIVTESYGAGERAEQLRNAADPASPVA